MELVKPEVKGTGESPLSPLIVITPQSSTYIPPDLEDRLAIDEDEVRRFAALYTDELFEEAVDIGGVFIPGTVSRFVVQLNKMTKMKDGKLQVWDKKLKPLSDADPRNSDSSFIRYSWTGNKVMDPELTEEEMVDIFNNIYTPYLEAIDKAVAEAQAKFGYSILIDGLSFPSVSVKGKERNADFVLGTRDWQTADEVIIWDMMDILTRKLKKVGVDNYGWNGGYTTGHYSQLASARKGFNPKKAHAVQIEINKKLYMDEAAFEKNSNFENIKNDVFCCVEGTSIFNPKK